MWARTLLRSQLHRTVRFARRSYNGQYQQQNAPGSLPTYFQPPPQAPKPPRRIFRSILLGSTCFALGAYGTFWFFELSSLDIGEHIAGDQEARALHDALSAGAEDSAARHVPVMDLKRAQEILSLRAGFSVTPTAVGHYSQLPSNMPCEDAMDSGIYNLFGDQNRDWANWSLFDGHAGPRTANLLREMLAVVVGHELWSGGCMDRDYVPDDYVVVRAIKKAFRTVDQDVLNEAAQRVVSGEGDLAHTVAMIAPAVAGSCALLALFDPARGVLRVANTGDSRAVLGRWDEGEGRYVAKAMSVDQTGFNEEEVERLGREHPDEEGVVDPKTGRVLGIAVSRAFGDARWKWSDEMTRTVYEKFWGPAPRPNGVVKTPPYLTAEPEVMEAKVETGEHPDFLIMATDGLWDNISSEDAVTCVQQWLDKYNPTGFFDNKSVVSSMDSIKGPKFNRKGKPQNQQAYKPDFTSDPNEDEETYWNETEKSMKWKVSPKHFVVEDENCGMHLVKNALGGKRRNLFRGVMSVQPPYSRNVRDDITVHVVFFGVDASQAVNNLSSKLAGK